MKKTGFFKMLIALFVLSFAATSVYADNERLVYSLDRGWGITGNRGNVGTPLKQDYDVAIRISEKQFVGMTIAALRVPIDTMTQLSNLKV